VARLGHQALAASGVLLQDLLRDLQVDGIVAMAVHHLHQAKAGSVQRLVLKHLLDQMAQDLDHKAHPKGTEDQGHKAHNTKGTEDLDPKAHDQITKVLTHKEGPDLQIMATVVDLKAIDSTL
jgi:hypothetical protein